MTQGELENLLAPLGNEADEVAKSLLREHFYGFPGDSTSCPVANYLKEKLPEGALVCVGGDEITVNGLHSGSEWWLEDIFETPQAIGDFVTLFDTKTYPELIAAEICEKITESEAV